MKTNNGGGKMFELNLKFEAALKIIRERDIVIKSQTSNGIYTHRGVTQSGRVISVTTPRFPRKDGIVKVTFYGFDTSVIGIDDVLGHENLPIDIPDVPWVKKFEEITGTKKWFHEWDETNEFLDALYTFYCSDLFQDMHEKMFLFRNNKIYPGEFDPVRIDAKATRFDEVSEYLIENNLEDVKNIFKK
jgi:hypothetical protein